MTPVGKGRFCDSCEKTVVDFTTMSDAQLMNYFKQQKGTVCGRIYQGQLNRPIHASYKNMTWLTYFLQISIPALLLSADAKAQEVKHIATHTVQTNYSELAQQVLKNDSLPEFITLSGKITDNTGRPVPFASVIVKQTREGVAADENGFYTISIKNKPQVLLVSAVGHLPVEYPLAMNTLSQDIYLSKEEIIFMGIFSYSRRAKKIKKEIKVVAKIDTVFSNRVTVYPNPASEGSFVRLRWLHPVKHNQNVEIYNITGALVQRNIIEVKKSIKEAAISLNISTAGNYALRITDLKTGKIITEQLIIQ